MGGNTDCQTVNILLAVAFATAGAIVSAIGYVVEKKAHNNIKKHNNSISILITEEEEEEESSEQSLTPPDKPNNTSNQQNRNNSNISLSSTKSFVTNPLWCTGFFIYFFGSILNASALKYGAQSVVAPLGALTLVANTILATKYLNESFNLRDIYGILLIILGSVLAIIFGPKSSCSDPTIFELKKDYINYIFLIFFIILTGITVFIFIATKYFEYLNFLKNKKKNQIISKKQLINTEITSYKLFLMISYTFIASYFGSINVLLMKSSVILIYNFEFSYLKNWFWWVITASIIIINVLLEYFRQRALKHFGALVVIPIYQVLLVIGSILMGAMYFNEFKHISGTDLGFFIMAILIIICGITVLSANFESTKNQNNIQNNVKINKNIQNNNKKAKNINDENNLSQFMLSP